MNSTPIKHHAFEVKSRLEALDDVLNASNQVFAPLISADDWLQVQLAIAEAFTNVVRHAHTHLPQDTPVRIQMTLYGHALELKIFDMGPSFDFHRKLAHLRQHPEKLRGGGRGLIILARIADQIDYVRLQDQYNCLHLIKKISVNFASLGANDGSPIA